MAESVRLQHTRLAEEAAISRYKRVIDDALRSQMAERQAIEVAIAIGVLNRMLELGRPESVRISQSEARVGQLSPRADPCNMVSRAR